MAEEHASTLLRQKAIEDKKMRELEKIRETLEVCLEEEKQAKKDEEIVRQLQGLFWILVMGFWGDFWGFGVVVFMGLWGFWETLEVCLEEEEKAKKDEEIMRQL